MLSLFLRTDKPESELYLYEDEKELAQIKWPAHRKLAETLNSKIDELLLGACKTTADINKIVVYKGPGSFTGLRIGISVANAMAYGLGMPVVGTEGKDWLSDGVTAAGSSRPVQPHYGGEIHITSPRK